MINELMKKYSQYKLRYDVPDKILFVYNSIIVKDFIELKNIIREYNIDIKEIRVKGE